MKISDKANRNLHEKPSEADEEFLQNLNKKLAEHPKPKQNTRFPVIFSMGSPRSGTTILAQSLGEFFDVGYIDNLAAKFWLAPATGLKLSNLIRGKATQSAQSYYGRTSAFDIHGFHYFWMHHFKLGNTSSLFESLASRKVEWSQIRGHLCNMEDICDRPMHFKGYYPSYFMKEVSQELPKAAFVLIRRDPILQGLSIYRARERIMRKTTSWWSMPPPGFEELLDRPVFEQIAGQVHGLKHFFQRQIRDSEATIKLAIVDYEDLVRDAVTTLSDLAEQLSGLLNYEIEVTGRVLEMKSHTVSDYSPRLVENISAALKKYENWGAQVDHEFYT